MSAIGRHHRSGGDDPDSRFRRKQNGISEGDGHVSAESCGICGGYGCLTCAYCCERCEQKRRPRETR